MLSTLCLFFSLCMQLELPHGIHRRLCSLRCATGVVLCAFPLSWLYHTTNISGVMILGSSSGCGAWYLDPSSSPDHWISWIHVFGCCGVIVFIYAACTALSTHCSVCVLAVVLHIAYHSTAVLIVTTCLIILIWILWGSFSGCDTRDNIWDPGSPEILGSLIHLVVWIHTLGSYPWDDLHPRDVPLCVSLFSLCSALHGIHLATLCHLRDVSQVDPRYEDYHILWHPGSHHVDPDPGAHMDLMTPDPEDPEVWRPGNGPFWRGLETTSSVDPSLSSIAAGPLEYPLLLPFAGTRGNPRSII